MPLAYQGAAAALYRAAYLPPPPPLPAATATAAAAASTNNAFPAGDDEVAVTKRGYVLCQSEIKRDILLGLFNSDLTLNQYTEKLKRETAATGIKLAGRSAVQNWVRKSGIGSMQRANLDAKKKGAPPPHSIDDATDKISEYISGVTRDKSEADKLRAELKMFLTLDEQQTILKSCAVISAMGYGLGESEITEVVNHLLAQREDTDKREAVDTEISAKVLRLMRKRYPDLGKLRTGGSIDIARAEKANEDTRDTMFMKLDEYVYLLCRMGMSPWERWADVPARNKYNMDEVGTDTTKRRKKIYAQESFLPLFRRTAEGDGKMNRHITLCITTRADGELHECSYYIYLSIYHSNYMC